MLLNFSASWNRRIPPESIDLVWDGLELEGRNKLAQSSIGKQAILLCMLISSYATARRLFTSAELEMNIGSIR